MVKIINPKSDQSCGSIGTKFDSSTFHTKNTHRLQLSVLSVWAVYSRNHFDSKTSIPIYAIYQLWLKKKTHFQSICHYKRNFFLQNLVGKLLPKPRPRVREMEVVGGHLHPIVGSPTLQMATSAGGRWNWVMTPMFRRKKMVVKPPHPRSHQGF